MATDSERLDDFIAAAKARGVSDEFAVALLRQNGWSERRIYQAFSTYYERVLGAPLPSRGGRFEYASEAFFYLLAFISLSIWATALWSLFEAVIDRHFPNPAEYAGYDNFRQTITLQLAALIVAFPIFAWVSRSIAQRLRNRPESAESGVRAWLTYVALTIASVIALGDTIYFVGAFLRGDVTTRLVLKTLVILALTGGIISYYVSTMRGKALDLVRDRGYAAAAVAGVALGLGFGFFDTGSPQHQRFVTLDERRISDIGALQRELDDTKILPATLAGLKRPIFGNDTRKDPVTDDFYEYARLEGRHYRICATFDTDDTQRQDGFAHPAGHTCFNR